jgi:hypothetical protein
MSGNNRIHPIKYLAAPLLAGSLVLGCNNPELGTQHNEYWEQPPGQDDNLCTIADFNVGEFEESQLVAETQEDIFSNYLKPMDGYLDQQSTLEIIDSIDREYGITVSFPEEPSEISIYQYETLAGDDEAMRSAVTTNLQSLMEALQLFSPNLIRALDAPEIIYVKNITRKAEFNDHQDSVDIPGGMYDLAEGKIYVDMASAIDNSTFFSETSAVVVHELIHAIDAQLLCGSTDIDVDLAIEQYNTINYQGFRNGEETLEDKYILPSEYRVFVNDYGATNVSEDRATILEWTLVDRGIIQPTDPDAHSPLAQKQAELLSRLEDLCPGTIQFIEQRTDLLRSGVAHNYNYRGIDGVYNELDLYITSELFPDEQLSGHEILTRAEKLGLHLEILSNGLLETVNPFNMASQHVKSPILIRNPEGEITAVAWGNDTYIFSENPEQSVDISRQTEVHYFDQNRMTIRHDSEQPAIITGPLKAESVEIPDESYDAMKSMILGINHVQSRQIYESNEYIARRYPNTL